MSDPIEARVLPHDLDAERATLGAVLIDPEQFPDCAEQVKPEDFYRDAHHRIFKHIAALDEAKVALDALTLRDSLARSGDLDPIGGPSYLFGLTDGVPRSRNAVEYARIVREKSELRQLVLV